MKKLFIKIRIKGLNLDKLIYEITNLNIPIFELQRENHASITIKTSKEGLKKIKSLKTIKFYSLKVLKVRNTYFAIKRMVSYLGILLGCIIPFLMFYAVSLNITNIDIVNNSSEHICNNGEKCIFSQNNISELAVYFDEIGLKIGNKVSSINPLEVERKIVAKFESVSSVTINKVGTHIKIELHEAQVEDNLKHNSLDIIAPENLKVLHINVSRGTPKVKAGDIVQKGQVLVKADGNKRAIAVVEATLYYKSSKVFCENQVVLRETGNQIKSSYISACGLDVFKKDIKSPYVYFDTIVEDKLVNDNLFFPLKVVTVTIKEMKEVSVFVDFNLVRRDLEYELLQKQEEIIGKDITEPLTSSFVVTNIADGVYLLDCYTEVFKIISS